MMNETKYVLTEKELKRIVRVAAESGIRKGMDDHTPSSDVVDGVIGSHTQSCATDHITHAVMARITEIEK